jgi:hypothetical protein
MMLLRHASITVLLLAAPLGAQEVTAPECRHGPADDDGIVITGSHAVHPTRLASVVDSVLEQGGYTVLRSPPAEGRWQIAPRFTWTAGEKEVAAEGDDHPGVGLFVSSQVRGDSTQLEVGARVLCQMAGGGAKATESTALEAMAAIMIESAISERLDTLRARGVALDQPVERPVRAMGVPDALGAFAFQERHDFPDPRMGTSLRYALPDGMRVDIYVYPGPPADSSCPQACAEQQAQSETREFTGHLPELVRRGHYRQASVASDDAIRPPAGAPWRVGRHLVARVDVQGEPRESHFYVFLFPGYEVKVRATYAPSDERRQAVEALVADALVKFAPRP